MRSLADIRIVTLLQNKVFFYVIYWRKNSFLEVLVLIGKCNICTVNSQIDACIHLHQNEWKSIGENTRLSNCDFCSYW